MNPLRAPRGLVGAGLAGVLLLSACAGEADPASDGKQPDDTSAATAPPDPAAPGPVTAVATVLQEGDGPPELCLGGVAESLPPQCGGPEIDGWDWDAVESETAQSTTWGEYAVVGTWDGGTFHLSDATSAPDEWSEPAADDPRLDPDSPGQAGPETLEGEAHELQAKAIEHLDGLSAWTENGYVWVTVVYDDGSIQRYADDRYGADTVAVVSALRDAE